MRLAAQSSAKALGAPKAGAGAFRALGAGVVRLWPPPRRRAIAVRLWLCRLRAQPAPANKGPASAAGAEFTDEDHLVNKILWETVIY